MMDCTGLKTRGHWSVQFRACIIACLLAFAADPQVALAHTLSYSTYLVGSAQNYHRTRAIRLDSAGNIYIAGAGAMTPNPTSSLGPGGTVQFAIVKFGPDRKTIVYSSWYGSSSTVDLYDLAISPAGEAYAVGLNVSCGSYPQNGFLLKLNSSGSAISFMHCLGGTVGAVASDSAGNVYVVGLGNVTTIDGSPVTFSGLCNSSACGYLAKFDSNGNLIRGTKIPAIQGTPVSMAIDGNGYIHIAGNGNVMPTALAFERSVPNTGVTHAFYARLDPTGYAVYATYLAGSGYDYAGGVAVDPAGNAWMTGETTSTDFPTVNPIQPARGGGQYDTFLTKINPAGAVVMSTYLGGNGDDLHPTVGVDLAGNAYVSSTTSSTDLSVVDGVQTKLNQPPSQPCCHPAEDTFIWGIDAAASRVLFSTYLGGSSGEENEGIVADGSQNVYVIGDTGSSDFPVVNPYLASAAPVAGFLSILSPFAGEMQSSPPPPGGPAVARIEQDNASIAYSGQWNPNSNSLNSSGTALLAVDRGASATLRFTGTGVAWVGLQDPYSGIANVYIDGQLAATVDTYSSSTVRQARLFATTGLANGPHTFVIQVTGTHSSAAQQSWVWIDALEFVGAVQSGADPVTPAGGSGGGIALVQSNAKEGSGLSSISAGFASANTAGNLIIAVVRMSTTSQTVSLSDTAGNVYSSAANVAQSSDGHQLRILYAKNIHAGSNTVTATFSGTNNHPWLAVFEYSGMDTVNPVDTASSNAGISASPFSDSSAGATTAPNELVFGAVGLPASFTGSVTAGSGFTLLQQDTGTSRAGTEAMTVNATGHYIASFTLSSSAAWTAAKVTFKAAGSSTSPPPPPPPSSSIARIQRTGAEGSGVSSLSVPFAGTTTAGNMIIAFVRMSTTFQTVTITDSQGNAYSDAVSQVQSADGSQVHIFYAPTIHGGADTVTATFSGTNNHPFLAIFEYSGVTTLDSTSHAQGNDASPNSGTTANASSSNELIFGGLDLPSSSAVTVTAGPAGWTLETQDTTVNGSRAATEDGIINNLPGPFDATFSLSGPANWASIVASFKP